jgi:predicted dehydrogenase
MATQFRAAIVGCGNIAGLKDTPRMDGMVGTHAQAYARHSMFTLAAVVDSNPERLEVFKKVWGVDRLYSSLTGLLADGDVDVISIASPNENHAEQLREILASSNAPRAAFVEKPVCSNMEEFGSLKKLVAQARCKVFVNHTRRYDPGHRRLQAFIKSGAMGRFLGGRVYYYGGWLHNGVHVVDTLRMLLGEVALKSAKRRAPGKIEDPCLDAALEHEGAIIEVEGVDERYYQLFENDLRFEKGRALIRDFGAEIIVEAVTVSGIGENELKPLPDSPWKGLDSPIYHAVDCIGRSLEGTLDVVGDSMLLEEAGATMSVLWDGKMMEQSGSSANG